MTRLPRHWLREYCESPTRFAAMILGLKLPKAQKEWTAHFGEHRFFHAAPRDHGKSTLYAFVLPLWEVARCPEKRVLIVGKTLDLASRFITSLREEIETNPRLIEVYGFLRPEKPRAWNRNALFLDRKRNIREPTLRALPVLGSCAGLRADLVIADDIIDSELCYFRSQRDRVHQWFLSELTPVLEADGRLLVAGTRKHHDDLYSRLIANPAYRSRIDRAILDESAKQVLMPERWPFERLLADREEIGTVLFNREKQNQVIDELTALFKRDWLEGCLDPLSFSGPQLNPGCIVVQGIDLAAVADPQRALASDSDYNAIVTLALEADDRLRVIDFWMERGLSPELLIESIVLQVRRHSPWLVVVENNSFQSWVERELSERIEVPVQGHTTGARNKHSFIEGVPSLAVLFERGKVVLPAGDEYSRKMSGLLIDQLHGLGLERHDDLAMAFWFAVSAARRVRERKRVAINLGPPVQRF